MQINEQDFHSFISVKLGLAPLSIRHCMSRFGLIMSWFRDKDLTKENVERFFMYPKEEKHLKNNSLNTYQFAFRHLVAYCKDRGLSYGFFDGFKSFKKTKSDIVIYTTEEIEKILSTELKYGNFHGKSSAFLDFRYRTMTTFLALTGCRYSEAANLTVRHLDISAGKAVFVDTKTNVNRTVYFSEPLKSNLRFLVEGRKPDDRVFRNSMESQVQVTDFSQDLKRRAKAAGVTKRAFPHNFRHSYITSLLEAGVPITEVAMLSGHRDIQSIYGTYMHLADKTLERAAMRHPMVRKNIDPKVIIRDIKEYMEGQHLENDNRFTYHIVDEGGKLGVEISIINYQKGAH